MHVYSNFFFFKEQEKMQSVWKSFAESFASRANIKFKRKRTRIQNCLPFLLTSDKFQWCGISLYQFEAAVPGVPPPNLITIPPQGGEKIRDGKREESNFASFAHQQPVLVCQHFYALIQAQFHKVCCEES